jgi:hypothetical protein
MGRSGILGATKGLTASRAPGTLKKLIGLTPKRRMVEEMDMFWWGFASGCAIPMAVAVAYLSAEMDWSPRRLVVGVLAVAWILGSVPIFHYGYEWASQLLPAPLHVAFSVAISGCWAVGTTVAFQLAMSFRVPRR